MTARLRLTTATLALLVLQGAASAAPKLNAVVGMGTVKCNEWTETMGKEQASTDVIAHSMVAWSQGFLSGLNLAWAVAVKKAPISLPDEGDSMSATTKACMAQPNARIESVIIKYFQGLVDK